MVQKVCFYFTFSDGAIKTNMTTPGDTSCSLLLVLLAGDHVALSHVEWWRVTVGVRRVLKQHRVVVLRLRTHDTPRG